jgi:hypothetical protein
MRAIQILMTLAALLMVCVPWLKRGATPSDGRTTIDELVKDPVCQTYVVRSRAVMRPGPQGPRYFCSDVCARRDA